MGTVIGGPKRSEDPVSRTLSAVRRMARPVVVAVTAASALAASALAYADGIDISHYQGTVSWSKVDAAGIGFAFMKATEGQTYADPTLRTNWNGAEARGIYRGAYHFARPSTSSGSAAAQARFFVSKVGPLQDKGDLPPVLDLEASGGLGRTSLTAWVTTWLTTVESLTGRTPMIYVSPGFWESYMGNSTAFHHYPLWVAHYTSGSPRVPGGWSTWSFWQRTSSGRVSGISGNVDMNKFNGSDAQLAKMANAFSGSDAPAPNGPTVPSGAATALTMDPATTTPAAGQAVTFSGELSTITPAATVAARAVTLWARPVGSTVWSQVAAGTTDEAGHYTLGSTFAKAADYQARTAGDAAYAASVSTLSRLATPVRRATALDLRKNRVTPRKGAALMLYGHLTSASKGVAGQQVRYYKRSLRGGRWIYVGRSRSAAPTGWHSLVVHPLVPRVWKAVYAGNTKLAPRTSRYLTVRPR